MVENGPGRTFGKLDSEGRIVLSVSGSTDIGDAIRGGRPIADFVGLTTEDGLKVIYSGRGNFTLICENPDVLRAFLKDKRYNIGARVFNEGSDIKLPR